MLVIDSKKITDFQKEMDIYLKNLKCLGYVHYDMGVVSDYQLKFQHRINSLARLVSESIRERTGNQSYGCTKEYVMNYYIYSKQVPEGLLTDKKTSGKSFNKKVVTKLRDLGYLDEVGEYYALYASAKIINGKLKNLKTSMKFFDELSREGSPLYRVTHRYNVYDSLRTYTEDTNHQGLPKDLNAMRAPEGYVLVSGDFSQSDLKIAYNMLLRDRSNIDNFYRIPDSYRATAVSIEGDAFDDDDFTVTRDIYKVNTLAPIYGAVKSATSVGQRVLNGVRRFINELPVYTSYVDRIKKKIEAGLPITLVSYFGNKATRLTGEGMLESTIMDQSLNWPVQTGTSEVVILGNNHIMAEFAKVGVTPENGGIYSYLNRHDEMIFLVKEEYLKYSYIFQETEDIQIDDWMPLKIEFHYHDIYGVDDEEYTAKAKSFYRVQPEIDLEEVIRNAKRNPKYFVPCKDTLEVCYASVAQDDFSIVSIKDELTTTCNIHKVDTTDKGRIQAYVSSYYDNLYQKLDSLGYNAVLVKSAEIDSKFVLSGNLAYVFTPNITTSQHQEVKGEAMRAMKTFMMKQGG